MKVTETTIRETNKNILPFIELLTMSFGAFEKGEKPVYISNKTNDIKYEYKIMEHILPKDHRVVKEGCQGTIHRTAIT